MLDQVFVRPSEPPYQLDEKWDTLLLDHLEARAKEEELHTIGSRTGSLMCLE